MMHLGGLVPFLLFLPSGARLSIRIDDSHHDSQQQNNVLANGLEVSGDAREEFIPGGFGMRVSRPVRPQAGTLLAGSKQDGRRPGHFDPHRVAPWFLLGPRRAKVALQAVSSPKEVYLPLKKAPVAVTGLAAHAFSRRAFVAGAGGAALAWRGTAPAARAAVKAGPRELPPEAAAAVEKALATAVTRGRWPVVLRLAFHDAGTFDKSEGDGGANGSIQFELDKKERPENFGLKRGWRTIQKALEGILGTPAEGLVGAADMIQLAAAYAVRESGGPSIPVRVGRVDATAADPKNRLLPEDADVSAQRASFARMGFNFRELIALSGAHTLGSKGFGEPYSFDNFYYKDMLKKVWLDKSDPMNEMIGIESDHKLGEEEAARAILAEYAENETLWFADFAAAFLRLGELGARWA